MRRPSHEPYNHDYGTSTTTTGDIVQMSPSTVTRLCLQVMTSHNQIVSPHEHNARYNNHTSTCETTRS